MQYTETYSCDNKRTEREKKKKKYPVESSSSIFMFFGLFTTETSHTKVSGQLGNTILHLPKGFPSPFLFFSSRLRQNILPPASLCSDSTTTDTYYRKTSIATQKYAHTMSPKKEAI